MIGSSTMTETNPRLHNEVYPFIHPAKFKKSLAGKVVVITGGCPIRHTDVQMLTSSVPGSAGTLGRALAECFSIAGARLALVYNRSLPPPELENKCKSLGASTITLLQCDVSDEDSCNNLVGKVCTESQSTPLDRG